MWSKFAIVKEPTPACEFELYFDNNTSGDPAECLSSGKYALIDLTDPMSDTLSNGLFFCVAHLCAEHALSILTLSHDRANLEDRKHAKEVVGRYHRAEELGAAGTEAEG